MRSKLRVFLKGLLMGACDIVPGISAGTIAFITGIYERLIRSIKAFSFLLIWDIILSIFRKKKKDIDEDIERLDLGFLIPLVLGIVTAIALLSRLISFLLENYFSFTLVFFIGLIIASSKTIFSHIDRHHNTNRFVALIGLLFGVSLMFIVPSGISNPGLPYIFLGGFLAIGAMMLPGISGSFILLVLGLYRFILHALENIFDNFGIIIIFISGILLGVFSMSRIISYLFKKDKSKTLYFLLGLVVGSLSIPIKGVYLEIPSGLWSMVLHGLLFILGVWGASFMNNLTKKDEV